MKKLVKLLSLFLFLVSGGYAQASAVDMRAAIDAQLRSNAAKHGIPGQAVLVLHNNDVLYRNGTGMTAIEAGTAVTPSSVFPVFSVSKLFTITLAMQLQEEGKIDFAEPASRYVDSLPQSWRKIRIDQFMNHASGIPEYFDSSDLSRPFPPSLKAVFESLKDRPVSAPGEQTRYTNTNNLVLAAVLESVTHTPYRTLLRKRILDALDLRETWLDRSEVPQARLAESYKTGTGQIEPAFLVAWPAYSAAHGGAYMTLDDLGNFMSAIAQGRLVSKTELLRLWKPFQLAQGAVGSFAAGWDYGQWGRWQELGHDGGTKVRARLLFDKNLDEHYVFIYLTNGNRDGVWSHTLTRSVQALVLPN